MLPLSLLYTAAGHPMLVELKSGETFNGHLVNCDNWMNLTLREVIQTSPDGDKFWRLPECYIRGNTIKYLNVPEEIVDMVKEEESKQRHNAGRGGRGRGNNGSYNNRGNRGRGQNRNTNGRGGIVIGARGGQQ
ncbi:uncharacterized protein B0P05DRAFT_527785 [Gilbertella persicaria]|uniref:uncharacterized protein n=1 Tax=Gilbertella persicaria TaxID=101096 RepID=UPI00221ED226|nr:uncharacterized protein B0P05DRAFT_527785 [Gilbertella persicaria]KAI8091486.1 hypothetical protein B0P05DRAFT_527785 [Gilbertella persicaria]